MTTLNQNAHVRMPRLQLPNRTLLFTTLLVITVASSPLAAQVPQVGKGERTVTFLGEKKAQAQSAPIANPRAVHTPRHLPTMDFQEYAYLKAAAEASASVSASTRPRSDLGSGSAVVQNFDFNGNDRLGSADQGFIFTPPDVNTAMGLGQIVEVTNNHFTCYDTTGSVLQDTPMGMFFGYNHLLTDPRVVYDHIWNRFIVVEVGFAENPSTQFFFIAASTSSDCTGSFNVFSFNMPIVAGDFYDYPQVGFDQDAAIFTFNVFNGAFKYAEVDMAAKAALYNGRGFSMPFLNGLPGTLTPNLVRDNGGTTVLINNAPGTTNVRLFRLINTSRNNPSITGPFTVDTHSPCAVPASAAQPGTTATLDTLDTRFQAPGTQIGNSLYNTQTCGPGVPFVRVLQVDISANALIRGDPLFLSSTSYDFNPSLATNDFGDTVVNWSSTDPLAGVNATTQFSGKVAGSGFGPLGTCFQSGTFSTAFRWGDTSGASVDPTDPNQRTFLISNETIEDASNWGTHVCSLTIP